MKVLAVPKSMARSSDNNPHNELRTMVLFPSGYTQAFKTKFLAELQEQGKSRSRGCFSHQYLLWLERGGLNGCLNMSAAALDQRGSRSPSSSLCSCSSSGE